MKVLLVAPKFPITYWGFQYSLPYTGKQVTLPPLGLVTMAALLPREWSLRLIDTDVRPLAAADLAWADVVLVGGMRIQGPSIHDILARARAAGVRTVVGGPAPSTSPAEAEIPLAMAGLLIALPGTALARRLAREGRLRTKSDGDAFGRPNFVPRMDEATLIRGYAELLKTIYAPEAYYERCARFVDRAARAKVRRPPSLQNLATFARAIAGIGLASPHRRLFWRLLWHSARRAPHNFSWAVGKTVMGEHLFRYTNEVVLPRLRLALAEVEEEAATAALAALQIEEVASASMAAVATG